MRTGRPTTPLVLSNQEHLYAHLYASTQSKEREDSSLPAPAASGPRSAGAATPVPSFSITYGKTAVTLGKEFGVPTRERRAFIDAYFDSLPQGAGARRRDRQGRAPHREGQDPLRKAALRPRDRLPEPDLGGGIRLINIEYSE